MLRLLTFTCLAGAVLALPTKTKEEVESFREFLLKAKPYTDGSLEANMAKYPWASAWENSGKYQGDIVLRDEEVEAMVEDFADEESAAQRTAVSSRQRIWPGNTIVYQFDGHTTAQQNQILGVMAIYESNTCVRFRRRTSERDYVRITSDNDGCYAHVGYSANLGAHVYNLAPGSCLRPGVIFHEFGHTVGFNHMHQARVRGSWIRLNWLNMQYGTRYNFNLVSMDESDMLGLDYEYASNQHYGPTAFSSNGRPTIVALKPGGEEMGQLEYITSWDIWRIQRLYSCAGAWRELRAEDAAKPAFNWPSDEELQAIGAKFAEEQDRRVNVGLPENQ